MDVHPKKSLGQHFLRDKKVLEKIIVAADLQPDDLVIEIGPGEGVLTEELAKRANKVIAIEIDEVLSNLLSNKFSNNKNVELINADILKIDLHQLISNKIPKSKFSISKFSYKIIANIPYYITSPIIRLFLEAEFPPREMILMIQKEVAERIVAKPGKMSILAVSVQYYARPELLFSVDKRSFFPVPEVDSAVIRLTYNRQPTTDNREVKNFFRVVRAGFSAKRKMLINNLSSSFHLDKKEVEEKLKKAGVDPAARAQELGLEDWKKLTRLFSE